MPVLSLTCRAYKNTNGTGVKVNIFLLAFPRKHQDIKAPLGARKEKFTCLKIHSISVDYFSPSRFVS